MKNRFPLTRTPGAVLFEFCASRGGEHPQRVLQDFTGTLVTDDYSGYQKLQRRKTVSFRAGTATGSNRCIALMQASSVYARNGAKAAHC
jgi:hypothetical protein